MVKRWQRGSVRTHWAELREMGEDGREIAPTVIYISRHLCIQLHVLLTHEDLI